MSVRLVRQASDTPNITNQDDSRMTRYAYGGIDGVMKGFGSEFSHSISGSTFILNSGCFVLQGWEVIVDSWQLDLSTVVGTQYHTVYLEVSVPSNAAFIRSSYQTGDFPTIDAGNDLTTYPNGTARIPLYTFVVTNGVISSVTRKFSYLSYYGQRLDDIEKRLDDLGFKEGSIILDSRYSGVSENYLMRQGNYVIGKIVIGGRHSISSPILIGTVSKDFIPSKEVWLPCSVNIQKDDYFSAEKFMLIINSKGEVRVSRVDEYIQNTYMEYFAATIGYSVAP